MGRRKTKFEVSLGEVSFKNITIKFETDQNDEPEVLESVRGALGNIIGTPTRLLMLEANGADQRPVSPSMPADIQTISSPSAPKPRRRRRLPALGSPTTPETQPGNNSGDLAVGATGIRPDSVKGQILQLHQVGYFRQERSPSEVGQELSNRWGRRIMTKHVATALKELTGSALSRRQTDDRKMLYRSVVHAV